MAHFRATIHGSRGPASRLGTKKSGIDCTVNGWTIGCSVNIWHDEKTGKDKITIQITNGSGYSDTKKEIVYQDGILHVKEL